MIVVNVHLMRIYYVTTHSFFVVCFAVFWEPGPSIQEPLPCIQDPGPCIQDPGPSIQEPGPCNYPGSCSVHLAWGACGRTGGRAAGASADGPQFPTCAPQYPTCV